MRNIIEPSKTGIPSPSLQAVVMGDLVSSQSASSTSRLYKIFNDSVHSTNQNSQAVLTSPLTITLGDEFQGLCSSLAGGLGIIRSLRYTLLKAGIACRFALGVATLETPLNTEKAWNMMGAGLYETRNKLSDKRNPNIYRFFLPGERLIEILLDALGSSITNIEESWTERQLEIMMASFAHHGNDIDLAKKLGVSRRTIYKVRSAGNQRFYESQWTAIEQAITELDQRYAFK